ncbi:hypothetical protein [Streptomyces globosus]
MARTAVAELRDPGNRQWCFRPATAHWQPVPAGASAAFTVGGHLPPD